MATDDHMPHDWMQVPFDGHPPMPAGHAMHQCKRCSWYLCCTPDELSDVNLNLKSKRCVEKEKAPLPAGMRLKLDCGCGKGKSCAQGNMWGELEATPVRSRGEWLNCASLIDDAMTDARFCEHVPEDQGEAGDWLITPTHISMIVRPRRYGPGGRIVNDFLVVDCSPRHGRQTAVNTGLPWDPAGDMVLRYKHYV